MKNKAPLVLTELIIMILIFALASALCLRAFVWAQQQSEQITLRDNAVLAVQNAAELIKSSKGDIKAAVDAADAETVDFTVTAENLDMNMRGIGCAEVAAVSPDGEEIFAVKVYWQEPLEGGDSGERK